MARDDDVWRLYTRPGPSAISDPKARSEVLREGRLALDDPYLRSTGYVEQKYPNATRTKPWTDEEIEDYIRNKAPREKGYEPDEGRLNAFIELAKARNKEFWNTYPEGDPRRVFNLNSVVITKPLPEKPGPLQILGPVAATALAGPIGGALVGSLMPGEHEGGAFDPLGGIPVVGPIIKAGKTVYDVIAKPWEASHKRQKEEQGKKDVETEPPKDKPITPPEPGRPGIEGAPPEGQPPQDQIPWPFGDVPGGWAGIDLPQPGPPTPPGTPPASQPPPGTQQGQPGEPADDTGTPPSVPTVPGQGGSGAPADDAGGDEGGPNLGGVLLGGGGGGGGAAPQQAVGALPGTIRAPGVGAYRPGGLFYDPAEYKLREAIMKNVLGPQQALNQIGLALLSQQQNSENFYG